MENRQISALLRCVFSHNYEKMLNNSKHLTRVYQFYATLDAYHMPQNPFGDLKHIIFQHGKSISWDYFKQLYSVQQQEKVSLPNKLSFDQ